ncbi:hypothetical protein [Kalamiella sp. sgz302252]|uniref:hypothetical protein n=1 Tax=Pantoea sp. sgz302252 TaxID=3341827 RepID=UPI0036D40599
MQRKNYFSWFGIAFGAIGLLLVVVNFMAGPFSPHATLEGMIAMKAVAIKQTTIAALTGKNLASALPVWDIDRLIATIIAVMATAAIVAGVIGGVLRENREAAIAAVLFGVSVIAFQLALTIIAGLLLIMLLVGLVHSFFS